MAWGRLERRVWNIGRSEKWLFIMILEDTLGKAMDLDYGKVIIGTVIVWAESHDLMRGFNSAVVYR